MRLRQMVGILLRYDDDILMIKRSDKQRIAPGLWSNIGGHMEPEEINNPQAACLRELAEETGYQASEIKELSLRYICMGEVDKELYIYYDYVATTSIKRTPQNCPEGKLAWVGIEHLADLRMPHSLNLLLTHYRAHSVDNTTYIGIMTGQAEQTVIQWKTLGEGTWGQVPCPTV